MTRICRRGMLVPIVLMTVLSSGCGESPTGGCDPCSTTAIVRGSVTDAAGQPQARIPVSIQTYLVECGAGFLGASSFRADSLGQFRSVVRSLYSPHTAGCVRVVTGSAPEWPVDTLDVPCRLDFRFDSNEAHLDSLIVNIVAGDS